MPPVSPVGRTVDAVAGGGLGVGDGGVAGVVDRHPWSVAIRLVFNMKSLVAERGGEAMEAD